MAAVAQLVAADQAEQQAEGRQKAQTQQGKSPPETTLTEVNVGAVAPGTAGDTGVQRDGSRFRLGALCLGRGCLGRQNCAAVGAEAVGRVPG